MDQKDIVDPGPDESQEVFVGSADFGEALVEVARLSDEQLDRTAKGQTFVHKLVLVLFVGSEIFEDRYGTNTVLVTVAADKMLESGRDVLEFGQCFLRNIKHINVHFK